MGNKKYTYDDFEYYAKKKDMIIISKRSDYQNSTTKMKYICPYHKDVGIQTTTLGRLLDGKGCYYCGLEKTRLAKTRAIDSEMKLKHKQLCEEKNFTYVDTTREILKNGKSRIIVSFICNNHKEMGVQKVVEHNFYRNQHCKYCVHKDLPKEQILKEVKESAPHIDIISDFKYLNDYVDCVCTKHKYYYRTKVVRLIRGMECYYCGIEKLSKQSFLSETEVDDRIKQITPHIKRIGDYTGVNNYIRFKCEKCGYEWDCKLQYLRYCPNCEQEYFYQGEHIVHTVLQEENINYEFQKRFEDCKNVRVLPFDFYLPDYNTCIEYQGIQHYKPVDLFGGDETYQVRQQNDEIKRQYCKENNIKLIEIPYLYNTKEKVSEYLLKQIC